MPKRSAGILLFRRTPALEVLLVHPGGPFFARKDVWGVPKGEYDVDEPALAAAYREFGEELGQPVPDGAAIDLGESTQKGGKRVLAWAVEGDLDVSQVQSNTVTITWQGRDLVIPEIDEARWFDLTTARTKIMPAQEDFLDRLLSATI